MSTYYQGVILADGPEATGAGTVDNGGGSPHGLTWLPSTPGDPGSAPTLDTGDYGYQLNGTTDYATTPYVGAPGNGTGAFSLECWLIPGSSASGAIMGAQGPGDTYPADILIIMDVDIIYVSMGGGSTQALAAFHSVPGLLRPSVWNHIVVTYDGISTVFLFINGIGVSLQLSVPWVVTGVSPLLIGASGTPNPLVQDFFFDGAISNVAIYNFPLSQQQVIKHLSAVKGVPAYPNASTYTGDYYPTILLANPAGYWRCDETAGALAVDRSGNGNDGAYGLGQFSLGATGAIYDGNAAVLLEEPPPGGWDATPAGIITPFRSISSDTEFSVEGWLFMTALPTGGYAVVCATSGGNPPAGDGEGIQVFIDDAGLLWCILLNAGSEIASLRTPSAVPSGEYFYCAVTFDLTTLKIYINGVIAAQTTSISGVMGAWGSNLAWGFFPRSYAEVTGQLAAALDEPAIYNYAMTPATVYLHYIAGLGPLVPPPPPVVEGTDNHYFLVYVYDKEGNLVDIPQSDIESLELNDSMNGGSTTSTMTFIRDFNNVGAVVYLYSVQVYIWNGRIAQPDHPTWSGYMVDIDQEKLRTTGKITVHLEGDQKQLDRGAVYEDVNPLVNGNPALDAADYIRHLFTTYAPASIGGGALLLACPPTLFPLLPGQYEMMPLGQVIDTVLKTGRDDLGDLVVWRVWCNANGVRTLQIRPDQNPNNIALNGCAIGFFAHHIFMEMCAKYEAHTKYSDIANVVTVQGGQDYQTGEPVIGSFIDEDSVAAFGPWEKIISVWQLISQSTCEAYAETWLDINGNPQANGKIELHVPDPTIVSGEWIQVWERIDPELGPIIKQMRVASVKWTVGRTRIAQEISPTAPTPYIDYAVYKMGLGNANRGQNQINNLPVNTQTNFVRLGGVVSHS